MNEPQTLEQFRDFSKVLKLKIMKQKMTIEQLETKNAKLAHELATIKKSSEKKDPPASTPHQSASLLNTTPSRPEINATTLKGKNDIMRLLRDGAGRLGITPESIFRIADVHGKHEVEYDHFRNTLSRMQLGLTPKEISTLIYMFDENCNSFITLGEYIETLQGYQVAEEDPEGSNLFKHLCLEKLASLMNEDQLSPSSLFVQMNSKKDGTVEMALFEDQIKKTFEGKIQEKEIAGSFYAMDLEGNGALDRQNFVYGINSSFKKLSTVGPSRRADSGSQLGRQAQPENTGMTNLSLINGMMDRIPNSGKKPNNESRVTISNENQNQESQIHLKIPLESLSAQEVLGKLKQESGISLASVYEELCRMSMEKRTTLFNFRKVLSGLGNGQRVEMSLVCSLFKLIDFQQRGSIHFSELLYFALSQPVQHSVILRLLGKYFHANDLSCDRFWFLFGINLDADISRHRFVEVMAKTFEGPSGSDKLWEKLWNYFDKGRGVLAVSTLSKEMSKYEVVENISS